MLTSNELISALESLGAELEKRDLVGEVLLVGGAAMCLVHSARDMTKDIDALYEPKTIINELVIQIGEEKGLPPNWLNDSVKGFLTPEAPRELFMNLPGLKVTVVSADYLLAMKLMSSRVGERDAEDIRFLLQKLNVTTQDEAYSILLRYYPQERIQPKTMYMLEECLECDVGFSQSR